MRWKRSCTDKLNREEKTTLSPCKKKTAVERGSLMESAKQKEELNPIFQEERSLLPISRPTDTLLVWKGTIVQKSFRVIQFCSVCTAVKRCANCECSQTCSNDDVEFVTAQALSKCRDVAEQPMIRAFRECKACDPVERGYVSFLNDTTCSIKFPNVERSIAFFQSHKSVFSLEWIKKPHISCQFEDALPTNSRLRLHILGKAFSTGISADEYVLMSNHELRKPAKKLWPVWADGSKIDDFVTMASGRYSNVVLQEKIRGLGQKDLFEMLCKLPGSSFVFLAKHKYGTYVIQLIVGMIQEEYLVNEVKKLLAPHASFLLQHEIGNYVVQKMLVFDAQFVLECFLQDFEEILQSKIGSRAFKNCAKEFSPYSEIILPLLSPLISKIGYTDEQKVLKTALKELLKSG
ncbi:hypothetical protein NECID01_1392 [Nematocida sp. AWRm77]|nr:hypothetical protein NECID01_1392 [Nematocida sp. AWRm77]